MALATLADIEKLFHTDFGDDDEPAVLLYIEQAQAAIEAVAGRPLEEETRTETYTVTSGDSLQLRTWPVAEIVEIGEDEVTVDPEHYSIHTETGIVERTSSVREWWPGDLVSYGWSQYPNAVVVEYTAGYPTDHPLYPDLRRLCATLAFRQFERAAAWAANKASGVEQESLGAYSVSYSVEARAPSMGELMTEEERRHIRRVYGSRSVGSLAFR